MAGDGAAAMANPIGVVLYGKNGKGFDDLDGGIKKYSSVLKLLSLEQQQI
jgi:hypothetical protein